MAEYIAKEAAIKAAEHAYHEWNLAMAAADGKREINLVYKRQELCKAVEAVFDIVHAADVAPVVRCKECAEFQQKGKYYNGTPFGYCYHWDYEEGSSPNKVDGNDFCSYGKRREDA